MTDRNRPTLRLRQPVTLPTEPRRPLGSASAAASGRVTIAIPPRHAPAPLEPHSRAILEELAQLGLADAPEG